MAGDCLVVRLPVRPWFKDHCFNGRVILAGVEAMQILAVTARAARPHLDLGRMAAGRFEKMLAIPPAAVELEVLVELEETADSGLCARLLTRTRFKTLSRMTAHCALTFAAGARGEGAEADWPPLAGAGLELTAAQVYQDLVPFGPAYRTLQDRLVLTAEAAWGTLLAPEPGPADDPLGSPFPLDGAMHAACVHGQRLVDFVPFPVGFADRILTRPTRAGQRYQVQVRLRSRTATALVYDLRILDQAGQVRETVRGLEMRDVSGGRIRPPAWLGQVAVDRERPVGPPSL